MNRRTIPGLCSYKGGCKTIWHLQSLLYWIVPGSHLDPWDVGSPQTLERGLETEQTEKVAKTATYI